MFGGGGRGLSLRPAEGEFCLRLAEGGPSTLDPGRPVTTGGPHPSEHGLGRSPYGATRRGAGWKSRAAPGGRAGTLAPGRRPGARSRLKPAPRARPIPGLRELCAEPPPPSSSLRVPLRVTLRVTIRAAIRPTLRAIIRRAGPGWNRPESGSVRTRWEGLRPERGPAGNSAGRQESSAGRQR